MTVASGKRLGTRLGIGSALIAVLLTILFVDRHSPVPFLSSVVAFLVGLGALREYATMLAARGGPALLGRAMLLGGALVMVARPIDAALGLGLGAAAVLGAVVVAVTAVGIATIGEWRTREVEPDALSHASGAFLGIFFVAAPLALLVEIGCLGGPETSSAGTPGIYLMMFTLFTSKLNDMGGYLVGSAVGRTKLWPGISPNKSLEGFLAGIIVSCVFAYFTATRLDVMVATGLGGGRAVVFAAAVSIATVSGDLFESFLKRAVGVKDSASLLPAFGGLFDLVDSFIFAVPVGYTLLRVWLGP